MLSAALALVLSQTAIVDKAAPGVHLAAPKAVDCPLNGSIQASSPAIDRGDLGKGFPDMIHKPPVDFIYALDQTINGCFTPKFVNGPRTLSVPKAAPKP
jgi:hypothetical protein